MLKFLFKLVDANKLGGWVRGGVGALLVIAISKWPALQDILGPEVQTALSVVISGVIVGAWSQATKTEKAKVAMVVALADDPASSVKGVVMTDTMAGRAISNAIPSPTVAPAGSVGAANIAAK